MTVTQTQLVKRHLHKQSRRPVEKVAAEIVATPDRDEVVVLVGVQKCNATTGNRNSV